MGDIAAKLNQANALLDKVKDVARPVVDFFRNTPKDRLWLYGGIAIGVIVLLWIIGAVAKSRRRRPYIPNSQAAIRAELREERRAIRRAQRFEYKCYRRLLRQRSKDKYYLPRKRRVRYVKTKKPRLQRPVKVQRVYGKADQSTMLATGIVGVGLGLMAHRAILEETRKFHR